MAKNLVIVESPAKVKTIKKFLGSNYEVTASMGHVRDLPKSSLGFDPETDFEPKYITIRGKGPLVADLKKLAKKADKIYLATDPDREGEAISWHLAQALKLEEKDIHRISFNEITKNAVKESLKHPRKIDADLVNAQQARRMLDRMVGYSISPLLWAKVKRGLSAGRVQSVALRLVGDREAAIDAFIPEEYWTIDATLLPEGSKKGLEAKFYGDSKGSIKLNSKADADKVLSAIKGKDFAVDEIKPGKRTKKAPLPFITSTLQQEASKKLNLSTQRTMRIAQALYENGYITYLRTDSTRLSDEAISSASKYIIEKYGAQYAQSVPKAAKTDNKIQDAHEAIRPTDIERTPQSLKNELDRDQLRLYKLIYNRHLASRMSDAVYETLSVKLKADEYIFTSSASRISFDGFLCVYNDSEENEEKKADEAALKKLSKDSVLSAESVEGTQHFTQPPAHYTEASLVHAMEELGIGRPSTYAPTITTILARHYIIKDKKNLFITELGSVVNNIMQKSFPTIVDVNFTVNMESLLDGVEEGLVKWKTIIANFYPDLMDAVSVAQDELDKVKVADEVSDEICDNCGRNMVIKYGPYGKFLACPGFPECKNTMPYFEKIGVMCPKCGKDIVMKRSKKGRIFYGCISSPECDYMSWQRPKA